MKFKDYSQEIKNKIKKTSQKLNKKQKTKPEKYDTFQEIKDWTISFIVAAVVYFLILPIFLHTTSPLVVVSSCSEKGVLDIGDILVIQGVSIKDIKAPTVKSDNLNFLVLNQKNQPYNYSDLQDNIEATKIAVGNKIIDLNKSNDIVVYNTKPFIGQVIHRAFLKIKKANNYYLITKGDANPIPDQMGFMTPNSQYQCQTENPGACISTLINDKMIVGKKILFRVPLLGHVKLFFCDIMPFCEGHSNVGTGHVYKLYC